MNQEELPIILVSAVNLGAANSLISEILEEEGAGDDAVWNISNKYYLADVRFCSFADNTSTPAVNGGPAPQPAAPAPGAPEHDAHIILLSENEGTKEATARVTSSGGLASVRIVASRVQSTEELTEWAARERYELISLVDHGEESSDDGDDGGIQRVREALQAHMWSNLRRVDRPDDSQDASAVERAERFAELLGGLRSIADTAPSLPTEDRHARAEAVVAAFCDALDDSDLSDLSDLDINDAESAL